MRSVVLSLLSLAVLGGAAVYFTQGFDGFLNFETGFMSGALVLAASAFGYWQMVSGSEESTPHHELPDIVEQIDDRYGLWEEDPAAAPQDVKALLAEEKARLKKSRRGLKGFLRTAKPALSLYRLGAYLALVAGVFWLIRTDLFEPVAYLVGAGLAPLGAAATLYFKR
ncbi:hypothetical protein [Hydrogenimonas sp.]